MKMYDNILQKVKLYEEKRGIYYAKTDGKLYKTVKVFYILAFAFTMFMNLLFVLGNVLSDTRFPVFKDTVYTVCALSAALIAGLVLIRFKKHIWVHITAFLLNALSSLALCLIFAKLLTDVVLNTNFYWRHLAPLSLLVLLSLWLTIIALKEIFKTRKNYKKVVENIYEIYSEENENKTLSDEEWDEILKNYE